MITPRSAERIAAVIGCDPAKLKPRTIGVAPTPPEAIAVSLTCQKCGDVELDSWDREMAWVNPGRAALLHVPPHRLGGGGAAAKPEAPRCRCQKGGGHERPRRDGPVRSLPAMASKGDCIGYLVFTCPWCAASTRTGPGATRRTSPTASPVSLLPPDAPAATCSSRKGGVMTPGRARVLAARGSAPQGCRATGAPSDWAAALTGDPVRPRASEGLPSAGGLGRSSLPEGEPGTVPVCRGLAHAERFGVRPHMDGMMRPSDLLDDGSGVGGARRSGPGKLKPHRSASRDGAPRECQADGTPNTRVSRRTPRRNHPESRDFTYSYKGLDKRYSQTLVVHTRRVNMRPEAKKRLAIEARLRGARKGKGLTQAQVALEANLSCQTISLRSSRGTSRGGRHPALPRFWS